MFLWDRGERIDFSHFVNVLNNARYPAAEFRPTEVHFKPDGAIGDKPSIAIVLKSPSGATGYMQISAEMLKPIWRVLKVLEDERALSKDAGGGP